PAYREAISHLNQALRAAEELGDDRNWQERRLQLLLLLGQAMIPLLGYSHSETLATFLRARDLSATIEDSRHAFSISYAMWVARYVRGEHAEALAVARDMHRRALGQNRDSHKLTALRALGIAQMITGELLEAHATLEEA